jgi:alkylhydroperoxidase family enzyme
MARVPLPDPDDADLDPAVREALLQLSSSPHGTPNVIRALANHPGLLRSPMQFLYGPDALITPAQRELAYLTASAVNDCHY